MNRLQRYLMFFGYNGSKFRGLQRHVKKVPLKTRLLTPGYTYEESFTVQGVLDSILYDLKPLNDSFTKCSSRTDKGVHAHLNTVAVDLLHPISYFDPKYITLKLNESLRKLEVDIRIHKTIGVRGDFRPRWAKSRSYVYKFASPKLKNTIPSITDYKDLPNSHYRHHHRLFEIEYLKESFSPSDLSANLPVELKDTITELSEPLNLDIFNTVLSLYKGPKNYTSFCNALHFQNLKKLLFGDVNYDISTKELMHFCVRDVEVKLESVRSPSSHPSTESFDFFQVSLSSQSFLHNQIRRMLGAAFGVCNKKISFETIEKALLEPSLQYHIPNADSTGLHLVNVEYSPLILEKSTDNVSYLPVLPLPDTSIELINWSSKTEYPSSLQRFLNSRKEYYSS